VRRTTIRKRMRAKLRELKQQLRMHMHDPVPQTGGWLKSVVPRLLQLLRGTREPRELGRVPGPIAGAVVANSSSPEPATPPTVDPDACAGSTMATSTARAPSLSCRSLRRQSSEIRTGCVNERPSGSGEGVARATTIPTPILDG
jgi:hypothetical protein